jgi:hypothetical protein
MCPAGMRPLIPPRCRPAGRGHPTHWPPYGSALSNCPPLNVDTNFDHQAGTGLGSLRLPAGQPPPWPEVTATSPRRDAAHTACERAGVSGAPFADSRSGRHGDRTSMCGIFAAADGPVLRLAGRSGCEP